MKCKNCGAIVQNSKICPFCRSKLDTSYQAGAYIFLSIVIASIITIIAIVATHDPNIPRESHIILVGHEYQTKDYAFLALNKEIYNRLTKLLAARDTIGRNMLISQGLVRFIPPKTKVLVIDISMFSDKAEVRILEGTYLGISGFMYTGFLEE